MHTGYVNILNPVGDTRVAGVSQAPNAYAPGSKQVIGLLNNSKPNVAFFLEAIEDELRRRGDYEVVSVSKPRSADASPDLAALAAQCDYVINAVAD